MQTSAQKMENPWHSGEIAVQTRLGVAEKMAVNGRRVIRDYMPDQHRDFYRAQPFMMIGTVDPEGDVWASMVTGKPGFITSPTRTTLDISVTPDPSDPATAGLAEGSGIGMLGIELATRRRNRMNGTIEQKTANSLQVHVGHSFGNCPQYIQQRDYRFTRDPAAEVTTIAETLDTLDSAARRLITESDTFFVASYVDLEDERQVDVSHRGGKPGFVRVDEDGTLTIPDFAGNLHFNTLGNFTINPKAGLIFIDFATGDVLQITGATEIIFDGPEVENFQGAERLWRVVPKHIIRRSGALAIRWAFSSEQAVSPNNQMTGSWEETAAKIDAQKQAKAWREMRIEAITAETNHISSFHLVPTDGGALIPYKAGQHLPVRAALAGGSEPVVRTYTVSSAPSDNQYRISVKQDGRFSRFLHSLKVGDVIEARGPAGAFCIDGAETRPAVMIAGGIGITPMVSMLREIIYEGKRTRGVRPTWLVHAAKRRTDRAFHAEIAGLAQDVEGAVKFLAVHSDPSDGEQAGTDYSWTGRFAASDLSRFLPFGDYDFYLCGPSGFMQQVYDDLRGLSVPDARIHAEGFGPSSLVRRPDGGAEAPQILDAATDSVPVIFGSSAKEARWEPYSGTLLDLAEARGIDAPHSCRQGSCGMCAVRLLKGKAVPTRTISADVPDGEILLCSTVPHKNSDPLEIDL